jgi:hypothetical protein
VSALDYVYDGQQVIIGRGKLGFEGFDREERSLGLFKTAPEAANAVADAAVNEGGAG